MSGRQRQPHHDSSKKILLSIPDVCDRLDIGRSTFYKMAAAGQIKVIKIGGLSKVHIDDLDALIASLREVA